MNLLQIAGNWLENVYRTRSQDWAYGWLEPDQVPGSKASRELQPGKFYFTLSLESMRVIDVRRGLNKFYGVVQSYVSVPHLSVKLAKFNTIIAPDNLKDMDAMHVDRVVTGSKPLVGPIPYHKGIDLQIGLFSVKSDNIAARFITLLESMSTIAGVSFITAAMPYIEPLKQGISLLTQLDGDDSILEIGLSRTIEPLKTGWFFVMRAPKENIDPATFQVTRNDHRLVDSMGNSIKAYPYMLFQVSASTKRPDWFMIPELATAYEVLQGHVKTGKFDDVEASLTAFKLATLTCPDLIERDAASLADKMDKKIKSIMQRAQTSARRQRKLPPFKDIGLYT